MDTYGYGYGDGDADVDTDVGKSANPDNYVVVDTDDGGDTVTGVGTCVDTATYAVVGAYTRYYGYGGVNDGDGGDLLMTR